MQQAYGEGGADNTLKILKIRQSYKLPRSKISVSYTFYVARSRNPQKRNPQIGDNHSRHINIISSVNASAAILHAPIMQEGP